MRVVVRGRRTPRAYAIEASLSRLGIHRPYLEVPTQNVSPDVVSNEYRQMLQSVRDYLREMNVAEQLADAMFRVEPEHIKYLTYKAVEGFRPDDMGPCLQGNDGRDRSEKAGHHPARVHGATESCAR